MIILCGKPLLGFIQRYPTVTIPGTVTGLPEESRKECKQEVMLDLIKKIQKAKKRDRLVEPGLCQKGLSNMAGGD